MTVALIDGDIIAYETAAAAQPKWDWGDVETVVIPDMAEAIPVLEARITEIRDAISADKLVVTLSDPVKNFRVNVLPTYKGNRVDRVRPELLMPLKRHLIEKHAAWIRPTLEGDDIIGIMATSQKVMPGRKVIVSKDKDMKTIPGEYLNMRDVGKQFPTPLVVTPADAAYFHLYQTIVGDKTDHYAGCYGAGPKKATKCLDQFRNGDHFDVRAAWHEGVVPMFVKFGFTEADALVQARVARILHARDYDFIKKEPILWTPPK
jgi:DNA polymerase-1